MYYKTIPKKATDFSRVDELDLETGIFKVFCIYLWNINIANIKYIW